MVVLVAWPLCLSLLSNKSDAPTLGPSEAMRREFSTRSRGCDGHAGISKGQGFDGHVEPWLVECGVREWVNVRESVICESSHLSFSLMLNSLAPCF